MKKLILFLVFLCALCANMSGQSTVAVMADLKSITGAVSVNDVARVQICFTLVAGDGSVPQDPRIIGTGIVVPFKNKCFTPADSSINTSTGHFSTNIIANDQISQNGVTGGTMWSVSIGYQGSYAWGGVYIFNLADSTENLNSKVSAVVSPFVSASPTDAVYARLDAGNMPFTGIPIAPSFTSTVATGTPPLVVASATNIPNLNASTLNGATHAAPGPIGSGTPSTAAFTTLNISGVSTLSGATVLAGGLKTFPVLKGDSSIPYILQIGDLGNSNGQEIGFQVEQWLQPTVNNAFLNFAQASEVLIPLANAKNFTGQEIGVYGTFSNFGSGTLNAGFGGAFEGFNPGPATSVTLIGGISATANNGGVTTGVPFTNQVPTNNGAVANLRSVDAVATNFSSGAVTNAVNFYAEGVNNPGGGTITNAIGLDVAAVTGATNNFAIRTNLGKVQLGDAFTAGSTAQFNSIVGIGAAPLTLAGLFINNSALAGTAQIGILAAPQCNLSATNECEGIRARFDTSASAFTTTVGQALHVVEGVKGAGSAITTEVGLEIETLSNGATNLALRTGANPSKFGGSINFANVLLSPTAPTIAAGGCGGAAASIATNNGTAAFTVNVGTTPTSAGCAIGMPTATNGWNCFATDITTNSTAVSQLKQTATGSSTTQVTIVNYSDISVATAPTASDIWQVSCFAR